MACDLLKTSEDYKNELNEPLSDDALLDLDTCIQASIDDKLAKLVEKDSTSVSYKFSSESDDITFQSMNKKTLKLYTINYYYLIFKLSIFFLLFGAYYLLSK
jgi:hypothetical protein